MYSKVEIQKAKSVNLLDFATHKGFDLQYDGSDNYRIVGQGGLIINESCFKHFSDNEGGDIIDFCMHIFGIEFQDAVTELIEFSDSHEQTREKKAGLERKNDNSFILPQRNQGDGRAIAYLSKTRGIPYFTTLKSLFQKG